MPSLWRLAAGSICYLTAAGSMAEMNAAGKVRIEGKEYVMVDGDIVEFRFNVLRHPVAVGAAGPEAMLQGPRSG